LPDSYVEFPTDGMSAESGTIALWANLTDPQPSQTKYLFGHTTIPQWANRIQLYMDSADTILDLGLGDSHNRQKDIATLDIGSWYHIALTWDAGSYVVYVDGQDAAAGTYAGLAEFNAVADLANDGNTTGRTEGYAGLLDDVLLYDRALSKAEVRYLAGDRAPLDPSLVAWWQLDDNTDDSTGNGHNGTIEGAPTWVSPGRDGAGACMRFGGDIDRITVDSFDVTGTGITLAAWINPVTLMNDARMISKSEGGSTNLHYWAMVLSGTGEDNLQFRLRTDVGNTTSYAAAEGTDVLVNEWTHVAVAWDAADPVMRLYKNGVEIDSRSKDGTMVATGAGVQIGIGNQSISALAQGPGNEIRPFDGLIDDVRVYDRGLSAAEILELAGQ
jgi:hypothetical protein